MGGDVGFKWEMHMSVGAATREQVMKVVIPGGSGQVGTILARSFHANGHEVVVLSRRPESRSWALCSGTARPPAFGGARLMDAMSSSIWLGAV